MSFSPTATTNGDLGFRIELDWSTSDDEDQVALRLQSQLMVALPPPHDVVSVDLKPTKDRDGVGVEMRVVRRKEALCSVRVARALGSTQSTGDGAVVLARLIRSNLASVPAADGPVAAGVPVFADHWRSVMALSLCNCGLMIDLMYFIIHNNHWLHPLRAREEFAPTSPPPSLPGTAAFCLPILGGLEAAESEGVAMLGRCTATSTTTTALLGRASACSRQPESSPHRMQMRLAVAGTSLLHLELLVLLWHGRGWFLMGTSASPGAAAGLVLHMLQGVP